MGKPKAKKVVKQAKPTTSKKAPPRPAAKVKVKVKAKARAAIPPPPVTQPSGAVRADKRGKSAKPAPPAPTRSSPAAAASRPRESSHRDDVRPSYSSNRGAAGSGEMELAWDEPEQVADPLARKWLARGEELLASLVGHGCGDYEYRADLKDGRFVWVDQEGLVAAESKLRVLCSWSKSTSSLVMGWADPLVRLASVPRVDGMSAEQDDVTEEGAWRTAMEAAEAVRAAYLYRVSTPHAWYFLALDDLSFEAFPRAFAPSTPVGLVLRTLDEARRAVESRAEPGSVVRERLYGVGGALLHEATFSYRETDWVARLERTGRCLLSLASHLPRPSFSSLAAGRSAEEFLTRETTLHLAQSIALLEDEWLLFG